MNDDRTKILPEVARVGAGTQLSGIYELDERLAAGGMGEVYRGHNIQTGDHVAIKIVLPEFARDETILSLFRKEASILNRLSHDAVVRYHVFTIDPGIGRPYLAMEFVDGEPLSDVMRHGPMPVDAVMRLCLRLSEGLAAVHEAHTFHRDLSPDNIILPEGRVERAKIIDFGIARSAKIGEATVLGGRFAGKYNYVSPEQLGLFGGEVSAQSDIYSLGLVLVAALRGKPLDMSGSQWEVVEKRRSLPDLSEIDPAMQPLLEAMLHPDPADRPPSMVEVVAWTRAHLPLADAPTWRPAPMPAGSPPPTWRPEEPPAFVPHVPPTLPSKAKAATPAGPARAGRTGSTALIAASVAAIILVAGAGAYFGGLFGPTIPDRIPGPTSDGPEEAPGPAPEAEPASPEPAPAEPQGPEPEEPSPPQEPQPEPATPEPQPEPVPEPQPAPTPEPQHPSEAVNGLAERVAWLRGYAGGDCFYATVTSASDSTTEIEGFGTEVQPFARLLSAFQTRFGMEPTVNVRPISEGQCAITHFLRALDATPAEPPQLTLERTLVPSGSPVSGAVRFDAGQKSSLLLVDHKGMAFSLDGRLTVETDHASFSFPIGLSAADRAAGAAVPQVVVAITAPSEVAAARFTNPEPADKVLPRILDEIRARGLKGAATAKFFRLGG